MQNSPRRQKVVNGLWSSYAIYVAFVVGTMLLDKDVEQYVNYIMFSCLGLSMIALVFFSWRLFTVDEEETNERIKRNVEARYKNVPRTNSKTY